MNQSQEQILRYAKYERLGEGLVISLSLGLIVFTFNAILQVLAGRWSPYSILFFCLFLFLSIIGGLCSIQPDLKLVNNMLYIKIAWRWYILRKDSLKVSYWANGDLRICSRDLPFGYWFTGSRYGGRCFLVAKDALQRAVWLLAWLNG
jgi:hypothetical protein